MGRRTKSTASPDSETPQKPEYPSSDAPRVKPKWRRRRQEDVLRKVLSIQTDSRFRGSTIGVSTVNEIVWLYPAYRDLDHVAVLRNNCAAAFKALDEPKQLRDRRNMPADRAVIRTLPVFAEAVARRVGRLAPHFPADTQDEEAARRYVEAALDWCDGNAANPEDADSAPAGDPVARMRAAISRERRVQLTLSGSYCADSFNWQAGVDRLWKCWDALLTDQARPPRPDCINYAQASDAANALLAKLPPRTPDQAGALLPPQGTKFQKKDAPAAFREGGKSEGAVLTAPYLADSTDWLLPGPYISKHYGPGKALTTYIHIGRAKAYLFTELLVLRDLKTKNLGDRERTT